MSAFETLPGALDTAAQRDADHRLLRCDAVDTTVGELQRASLNVAAALRGWNVAQGDRTAIMMRNGPDFVGIWFGVARAGSIEVPVHTEYRGPLLEHILCESQARVLFCDAEFVPRLAGLDLPALERIVVAAGDAVSAPPGFAVHPLEEALADRAAVDAPPLSAESVSCILYTSGTTGPSKGVVLTHGANLALARANIALMEYTPDDVLYTAFPLFHVNAKFTSVASAMIVGARLVLDDHFSASRFWDQIRAERVTAFNYMGGLLSILASSRRARPTATTR